MRQTIVATGLCAFFVLSGCSDADPMAPDGPDDGIVDGLAEIPEPTANAVQIEFPEQIIEPGTDVMRCFYPDVTFEEDTWVSAAQAYQGVNGHHLLLFQALAPEDPGTVIDCTDEASMATFMPTIFTDNFADGPLPSGHAVKVPAGTRLVLQQHYVNTTLESLRVRDAVVMNTVTEAEVDEALGFYALTDVNFEIPAQATGHDVVFECSPDEDGVEVMMIAPHMHEWGVSTSIEVLRGDDEWEMLQDVPKWEAEMRDYPPVDRRFEGGIFLDMTDRLRITCTYDNADAMPLGFPNEMCAFYGYFKSPTGRPAWICAD